MLTRDENDLLARTGPGTPMGGLMRRYWIPALFSTQLARPDCPPLRVKLLGERLVAFRDTSGRVGLVEERCPHRGASMFFGRNEHNGLRCVYHGWKFEIDGRCVDMPSEPGDSNFKNKVRIAAYPCVERGGVVWAYMGPPEQQPAFPELEWTRIPESHRYATRHIQECNWLQGLEGGFDASHLTFLHRGDTEGGQRPLPTGYESVATDFGMVLAAGRPAEDGSLSWTAECMAFPFHKLIARQPGRPHGAHMWVPIDDRNCMIWSIEYQPGRPLNREEMDRSLEWRYIHAENLPGSDRCTRNRDNDYLIDRELQASGKSYTGFTGFGIQDCGIQESMGAIADRTAEHLGTSDINVIQLRRRILGAIRTLQQGGALPGMDPASYRVLPNNFVHPDGQSIAPVAAACVLIEETAPAKVNPAAPPIPVSGPPA
jgi:phthalate 4,5-dioxygenase oxygenase subunit